MNKEEKLAYLDKLVEPQGNESGMSVAPLLREMIEDAGDQVEVDGAIEAAKEAQKTADAAEAAATAAGTAAQEANTAAGNAQTAADNAATAAQNAQKTADEALQAAQNAGVGKPGTGTNSEIFNDYENNEASEDYSHSEGSYTHAVGICSHAEGNLTRASHYSHAEGYNSNASGGNSHAEGNSTVASGNRCHSEGYTTVASGDNSHAEGSNTNASGKNSHAEGSGSRASGNSSHSEGSNTKASGDYSHAEGALNVDLNGTEDKFKMRHMVGIGDTTGNLTRKNAHTIMTNGDHYIIGVGGYQGTEGTEEAFGNIKTLQAVISEMVQLSDTAPSSDVSTASAGTSDEAARADHVHPFAPGDIQNPKSMRGVDLDTILEPGYYEGVPAAKEGNPTVTDFASLVVMRGNGADSLCQIIYADGEEVLFRVKPNASNNWSDWKPLSETDLTGTAVKPNTFASGDLDTLTQTGMYVLTSDILSDYTNFPPVPTGYTPYYPVLYVYNSGGVVSQTISVNHGDNKLYSYSRNNQPGSFNDWRGGAVGGGISYVYEIATLDPYDGNGSEDAGGTVVINTPYKENQIIEVAMNTTGLGTGKSLTFRVLRSTETFGSMTVTVPPVDTFDDKGSIHFTVADLNPTTGNNPVLLSWWFSLDNA